MRTRLCLAYTQGLFEPYDGAEAQDFSTSLFGWADGGSIDTGPMGTYRFFAIDAAVARVQQGGMLCNRPHQTLGGSRIVQACGVCSALWLQRAKCYSASQFMAMSSVPLAVTCTGTLLRWPSGHSNTTVYSPS